MKVREKSDEKFAPSSLALYNIGAQRPQGCMNEKVRWNQMKCKHRLDGLLDCCQMRPSMFMFGGGMNFE